VKLLICRSVRKYNLLAPLQYTLFFHFFLVLPVGDCVLLQLLFLHSVLINIGVSFGLSTLTAAGFGQCVSDVAGFTCGGIVDATVAKLKLPHHNLSPAQLDLKRSRIAYTMGGCVGVVVGCLLGMSCLFFMDTDRADRAKKAKKIQSIFETVIVEGHQLIDAGKYIPCC
jgi:hypothetical protein